MMAIPILFVASGLVGAAISALSGYLVSGLTGSPYPVFGPSGLTALVLGFMGGIGAPMLWSLLGVGFAKSQSNANDTERERWFYVVCVLAPMLGMMQGVFVFLMGYPKPTASLLLAVPYVLAFILVAESVGVLGRVFNRLLELVG